MPSKVIQPQISSQIDADFPHSDLTHTIIGCIYTVFNEVKFGYQEKYYQRALAAEFDEKGIVYQREQYQKLQYKGRTIGRYFVDFVVENTVVVELKVANEVFDTHTNQVLGYMRSCGLPVGLLALIRQDGIKIKRLVLSKDQR